MCTTADREETRKWRARKVKWIYAWKQLNYEGMAPIRSYPHYQGRVAEGVRQGVHTREVHEDQGREDSLGGFRRCAWCGEPNEESYCRFVHVDNSGYRGYPWTWGPNERTLEVST